MKDGGLSIRLREGSELPWKLPASPPMGGSHVSGPSCWCREQQKWRIQGWLSHLLELFKEGHSGLGTLQGKLFDGIVLAASTTPVRVLVM